MPALARPFLPTKDFEAAKQFYLALGFELRLDGDVAIFGVSASSYADMPEAHYMMQLMVDDLDAWWNKIAAFDLPARFSVRAPREPVLQPWASRSLA